MADALMSNLETNDHHLVLELVLLRLPSPACLVNAAAACKLWRRVIADSGFLRLWRSLHTPAAAAVAGYYFNVVHCKGPNRGIRQSFVPSPPPPPTPMPPDTTIHACHFSLDFLPDFADRYWRILDSRGSLLLMKDVGHHRAGFPDMLVVCNPLTRCYKRIPPPPDLSASCWLDEFYLVDGEAGAAAAADGVGGRVSMSNFRVLCEVQCNRITHNALFTSGGAGVDDGSWTDKAIIETVARRLHHKRHFGRAGGRWYYLAAGDDRTLISLDGRTGEYSSFVLPATEDWTRHLWNYPVFITDGRDGRPRIFSAVDGIFKVFARLDKKDSNDGGDCWALEKKLVLQEATRGLPGYKPSFFNKLLSVQTWVPGSSVTLLAVAAERWLFSVDLETMEVKPVASAADMDRWMYEYQLPWPPVLHACLD